MANAIDFLKNKTVSISEFNKGKASKIIEDLNKTGMKVIMNHNAPAAVLLSCEKYAKMKEEIEEIELARLAEKRLKNYDPSKTITFEEILKEDGLTEDDLEGWEDIEFE